MHGAEETSQLPRTVWTVAHLVIVLTVAWLYFGGGSAAAGDMGRRAVLFAFAVALWVRMAITAFVLLERRFDWSECFPVIGAVAFYQFGFALLGGGNSAPLNVLDVLGIALLVFFVNFRIL